MSFGENKKARIAELESRIEHLETTNGALCAEINRQERVIEEQRAQITRLVAANDARAERIRELESLVRFMEPFFLSAVSHECGCPDGYFEPHGCDDGCKALKELNDRMAELGLAVDE